MATTLTEIQRENAELRSMLDDLKQVVKQLTDAVSSSNKSLKAANPPLSPQDIGAMYFAAFDEKVKCFPQSGDTWLIIRRSDGKEKLVTMDELNFMLLEYKSRKNKRAPGGAR